jgi:hypothetical protein
MERRSPPGSWVDASLDGSEIGGPVPENGMLTLTFTPDDMCETFFLSSEIIASPND